MQLEREGREKISSPYSVKLLEIKSLPKCGGVIHIGSLYYFSSISMLLEWKKIGGIILEGHFSGRS